MTKPTDSQGKYNIPPAAMQGGIFVKVYYHLPNGGEFYWEVEPRAPMSKERFNMICLLIGIFIGGYGLLKFIALIW